MRYNIAPCKQCSDANDKSSGRTYEPVDDKLIDAKAARSAGYLLRVHPRDFVQVTHTEAGERFWVQVVKRKDGVVWGIIDNSLILVDWPQGKKIRFSASRISDIYAGEA